MKCVVLESQVTVDCLVHSRMKVARIYQFDQLLFFFINFIYPG